MFLFDTVDDVVKDFTKVVKRLDKLKVDYDEQAENVETRAAYLFDQARDLRKESLRADRMSNKFRKFLED